jgi:hypothetical protein
LAIFQSFGREAPYLAPVCNQAGSGAFRAPAITVTHVNNPAKGYCTNHYSRAPLLSRSISRWRQNCASPVSTTRSDSRRRRKHLRRLFTRFPRRTKSILQRSNASSANLIAFFNVSTTAYEEQNHFRSQVDVAKRNSQSDFTRTRHPEGVVVRHRHPPVRHGASRRPCRRPQARR